MPILKPILLLVLFITTSTSLAAPGDTLYVRGNNVNVRVAPNLVKVDWIYGILVEKVPQNDDIGLLGSIHT